MDTQFDTLGKVLWIWGCSPLHRRWPIESAIHYVLPAIEHQQFRLLVGSDGIPRGYTSWAWLNANSEKRYIANPNSLRPEDWHNGKRLWFIDFISPFGFLYTAQLRRLMGEVHGNSYLAHSIRLRDNGKAQLVEHVAGSTDIQKSQTLKNAFYEEIKDYFLLNKRHNPNDDLTTHDLYS
ncbi:toxin-activating lysine-acyltransferase [Suttonella ornithocola]|nr:toxin-activating lysine-acyltransferase [Suttonella ornithocola]